MYTDGDEESLNKYRSAAADPADFNEFWRNTLAEHRAKSGPITRDRMDTPNVLIDTYDVTFPGFNADPIKGWLHVPHGATDPLPTVVEYIGYGGGRGHHIISSAFAQAGFAHFLMDTRGQGGAQYSQGETGDPEGTNGPAVPGVMTRGIRSREEYFYRRLFTDAARAIDAVRTFDEVDASRVSITGISQGGGVALAAAYLVPDIVAIAPRVPFLCDYRHAVTVTDAKPFAEITEYLSGHRNDDEQVFETLSYFDGVNFAKRITIPANFVVALMDKTVPPSSIYGAYNAYAGPKELIVRHHNGHESGGPYDLEAAIKFFQHHLH